MNREQSFVKFHIDTLLFRGSGDATGDKPKRQDWNVDNLFSGWMKNVVRHAVARRDMTFLYSIQKGVKKAWPKMSPHSLAKAYRDHAEDFSTDHGVLPQDLKMKIYEVSAKLFEKVEPGMYTKFIPRGSACTESSRKTGGCLELFQPFVFPTAEEESKLGRLRALIVKLEEWRAAGIREAQDLVDQSLLRDVFPLVLDATAVGVFEPGKIRMITKGDGFLFSLLQPLQGVMVDCWKDRPESTMNHPDLTSRIRKIQIETQATQLTHWASVDYTSATDKIKQDGTFAALTGLIGKPYYEYAYLSFGVGRITYPSVYPDDLESGSLEPIQESFSVLRIDGQPMGHPLSFPLLCLINLAVYQTAIDRWVETGRLGNRGYRRCLGKIMRRNVLVNGDDMLFKCHPEFYPIFNECARDAGLFRSMGKQYLSDTFCMINSQIFTFKRTKIGIPNDFRYVLPSVRNLSPQRYDAFLHRTILMSDSVTMQVDNYSLARRVGYLNMNIVDGNTLKKTSDVQATPSGIAADANEMIRLCPWSRCCLPVILDKWRDDWKKMRFQPDWFIKPWLGGFGVDRCYALPGWKPNKSARRVARSFAHDPRLALYRMKKVGVKLGRYIHDLVDYKMVPLAYQRPLTELEALLDKEGDKWLGQMMYAGRLCNGAEILDSEAVFADKSILKVFKQTKYLRLKPFTDADFELYDSVQFRANFRAPCPPPVPLLSTSKIRGGEVDARDLPCDPQIQKRLTNVPADLGRETDHPWFPSDCYREFIRQSRREVCSTKERMEYYESLPSWNGLRDEVLSLIEPPDLYKSLKVPMTSETIKVRNVLQKIPYRDRLDQMESFLDIRNRVFPGHYSFLNSELRNLDDRLLSLGLETYSVACKTDALQKRGTAQNLQMGETYSGVKFGYCNIFTPQFRRLTKDEIKLLIADLPPPVEKVVQSVWPLGCTEVSPVREKGRDYRKVPLIAFVRKGIE
jgi:hypothetical protein